MLLAVLMLPTMLMASSNMSDGIILNITEEGKVHILITFQPYSSFQGMRNRMIHGPEIDYEAFLREFYATKTSKKEQRGLERELSRKRVETSLPGYASGFYVPHVLAADLRSSRWPSPMTTWIDQTPVTIAQWKAAARPGMRVSIMENGAFHFLALVVRGHGNRLGYVVRSEQDQLVLKRPQGGGGREMYPKNGVTHDVFPPHRIDIDTTIETVIKKDGRLISYAPGVLNPEEWVLVQAPRVHQRVELLPPNHGDWNERVNTVKPHSTRARGFADFTFASSYFGVMTEDGTRVAKQNEADWRGQKGRDNDKEIKPKPNGIPNAYDSVLIAGGHEKPGPVVRAHYSKGGTPILDGMYTDAWPQESEWKSLFRTGRIFVAITRRGRTQPDKYLITSDVPSAWGVITGIAGNEVTVDMQKLSHVVSGTQTITIDPDATFHHLGQNVDRNQVLQQGNLIKVFAPRPQTILVNDGNDHLISTALP